MPGRGRTWWPGAALFLAAAGIFAHQLLFRPIVGLADNGDFARITQPLDLDVDAPPAERYGSYVWRGYRVAPGVPRRYRSSEVLLAGIARSASSIFHRRTFDLRWLGAVHAGALLGAAIVLWRESASLPSLARVAAFGFALFAFTDVGYVAALNSFYTQAGSLVFLIWTVAAGIAAARRPGRIVPLAGYFAAAALFVSSKPQEALQAIPFALFGAFLALRGAAGVRRAGLVFAAALLAVGAALAVGIRGRFREGAIYKMIFYEILPSSPDPAGDLRVLGLPEGDRQFSGTTNYQADSPFQDPAIRARISSVGYRALLRLYLARPARAVRELSRDARAGWELSPRLGNFEKSAGFAPGARSAAYSAWGRLRGRAFPAAGILLLVVFVGNAGLAAFGRIPREARAGLGTLVFAGAVAYGICTLASAHLEIVRKLYVFHAITDVLLAADLAAAAVVLGRRT